MVGDGMVAMASSGTTLRLSTPLSEMKPGVFYKMEVSSNLANWTTQGTNVQLIGNELVGTVPRSGDTMYARWKVTQAP
jgi:hypothetical protein